MKPTIKSVAIAFEKKAYGLAVLLASDEMGEKKVLVTSQLLRDALPEGCRDKATDDIVNQLFKLFAPQAHLQNCEDIGGTHVVVNPAYFSI